MTKDFSLLILKILKFNVFFINFEQFGIFLFLKIHLYKYPAFGGWFWGLSWFNLYVFAYSGLYWKLDFLWFVI